jgi:hypothetical protein
VSASTYSFFWLATIGCRLCHLMGGRNVRCTCAVVERNCSCVVFCGREEIFWCPVHHRREFVITVEQADNDKLNLVSYHLGSNGSRQCLYNWYYIRDDYEQ